MALLVEDTNFESRRRGGLVVTITGRYLALQGNKARSRNLFLRLCPWCGADISKGVSAWKVIAP